MSTNQCKRMPRIGEMLVARGLVTPEALGQALEEQSKTGGKIGQVLSRLGLVTTKLIDRCMTEDVIAPILIREMDALTDGRYSRLTDTNIIFRRLSRTKLVTSDLLDGSEDRDEVINILGEAVIQLAGQTSLPFEFSINPETSEIKIDQFFRGGLRVWLRRLLVDDAPQ